MHNVYDCVEAFEKLLDQEYHLVLGRKNTAVSLQINFDKKECFHLMGLQYLTDRPELVRDRGKIFDAIRERQIMAEHLQSSDLYYKIADRIDMLPFLESMIDSKEDISAVHFSRRIKWITLRIRHHGLYCIRRKYLFQQEKKKYCMTD